MSNLLKDRLDILMDKAKSGDAKAQLGLAKCFHRGHLVEKSLDQARYWAFKSISGGNKSAIKFYQDLNHLGETSIDRLVSFCEMIRAITIGEFFVGLGFTCILSLLDLDENIFYFCCLWAFLTGIVAFMFSLLTGIIGRAFDKSKGEPIGAFLGILIVHAVALWIVWL